MDGNATITIGFLFVAIGSIITVYNFNVGRKKDIQADEGILNEIKTSVLKANMKLDSQCTQLMDLQSDIKSTRNDVERMRETQIKHDMRIESLEKQLEKINK